MPPLDILYLGSGAEDESAYHRLTAARVGHVELVRGDIERAEAELAARARDVLVVDAAVVPAGGEDLQRLPRINRRPLAVVIAGSAAAASCAPADREWPAWMKPCENATTAGLRTCVLDAVLAAARERIPPQVAELMTRSPHLAAWLQPDGRMIYLNPVGRRLLGTECWLRSAIWDWAVLDSATALRDALEQAIGRRESRQVRTVLKRGDGERVPATLTLVPLFEATGGEAGVYATAQRLSDAAAHGTVIQETAERFRRLVELSPDAIFIELDGIIRFANQAALDIVGAVEEHQVVGRAAGAFIHKTSWNRALDRSARVQRGETVALSRERLRRLDGATREVEISATPVTWHGRSAVQGVVRDVTEREQTASALRQAEKKLADILGSVDNVVWSASIADHRLLYLNPAAEALYGRRVEDLLGNQRLWREAIHPEDRGFVLGSLRRLLREGSVTREFRIVRADGSIRWVEDRVRVAYDDDGNAVRVDGVSNDITQRKEHERHIKYLANYDELTGLPNRNLFADRLTQWLPHARRTGQLLAVVFVGIDRLKHINDSFGHGIGDRLLHALAQRLRGLIREGDTLARFAGDEFTLLLPQASGPDAVAALARDILKRAGEPFEIDGRELHVSVSLGISLYPNDGQDMETLSQHADTAMFRAKASGGDTFQFYADRMSREARERAELETALRYAHQDGELTLHYQPQIDLRSGAIVGLEALLRWRHPSRGMIPPDQFIPIAEETGLILPVGNAVLRDACRQLKDWLHRGIADCRMAVNLSARQFMDPELLRQLEAILADSGLDPSYLDIELTETAVLQNQSEVARILRGMKSLGISVSMDDFGTGYSSLSYLKRFPIDRVKIDKSFIQGVHRSTGDAVIAEAIISLGHSLGLTVVAEGVESLDELAHLRSNGCDEVQGFLFSKPLPAPACEKLLRRPPVWPGLEPRPAEQADPLQAADSATDEPG